MDPSVGDYVRDRSNGLTRQIVDLRSSPLLGEMVVLDDGTRLSLNHLYLGWEIISKGRNARTMACVIVAVAVILLAIIGLGAGILFWLLF